MTTVLMIRDWWLLLLTWWRCCIIDGDDCWRGIDPLVTILLVTADSDDDVVLLLLTVDGDGDGIYWWWWRWWLTLTLWWSVLLVVVERTDVELTWRWAVLMTIIDIPSVDMILDVTVLWWYYWWPFIRYWTIYRHWWRWLFVVIWCGDGDVGIGDGRYSLLFPVDGDPHRCIWLVFPFVVGDGTDCWPVLLVLHSVRCCCWRCLVLLFDRWRIAHWRCFRCCCWFCLLTLIVGDRCVVVGDVQTGGGDDCCWRMTLVYWRYCVVVVLLLWMTCRYYYPVTVTICCWRWQCCWRYC